MLSKEDLNDIAKWLHTNFTTRSCYNFTDPKLTKYLKKTYGLVMLSSSGVSRTVFKKPYSKEVVKLSYFVHNIAEKCVYDRYVDTGIEKILAKIYGISDCGTVMTQEYVSGTFPGEHTYNYEYCDIYCGKPFIEFNKAVASLFTTTCVVRDDFHESNLRHCKNGDMKIIDYAHVGDKLTTKYYITKTKSYSDTIRREIAKNLKKFKPIKGHIEFTYDGTITLRTSLTHISIPLSRASRKELEY